jgi:hypothetical protein
MIVKACKIIKFNLIGLVKKLAKLERLVFYGEKKFDLSPDYQV